MSSLAQSVIASSSSSRGSVPDARLLPAVRLANYARQIFIRPSILGEAKDKLPAHSFGAPRQHCRAGPRVYLSLPSGLEASSPCE